MNSGTDPICVIARRNDEAISKQIHPDFMGSLPRGRDDSNKARVQIQVNIKQSVASFNSLLKPFNQMDLIYTHSITELTGEDWGTPPYDSTLVSRCYQLRKKPLNTFSIEDLRIMIGQNISLEYVIPLALRRLTQNILAEGDFYPGDLLEKILRSEARFWLSNPGSRQQVIDLYLNHQSQVETADMFESIQAAFERFRQIQ
jgi:hypothetical protein